MMQDGIDLFGEHSIDRGNVAIHRIAQRLRIDPQAAAVVAAKPQSDRVARIGIEKSADGIGKFGVPAAGETPRQHRIANPR